MLGARVQKKVQVTSPRGNILLDRISTWGIVGWKIPPRQPGSPGHISLRDFATKVPRGTQYVYRKLTQDNASFFAGTLDSQFSKIHQLRRRREISTSSITHFCISFWSLFLSPKWKERNVFHGNFTSSFFLVWFANHLRVWMDFFLFSIRSEIWW